MTQDFLSLENLLKEQLSSEETGKLKKRQIKYELIRFLYMEKMKANGEKGLVNFHFTPGTNFEETPIIDVVNTLIELNNESNSAEAFSFNDLKWKKHNPPDTGLRKTSI